MFISDKDNELISDALPVGWFQVDRNVWQRLTGYKGAPTAQITDTAIGLICDSFLMQPHRMLLCPSPGVSSQAATLDAVEAATRELQAAEQAGPKHSRWLPVQGTRAIPHELGPDLPVLHYFPTARGLKAATVVAGHVIVVVEVFGAMQHSMFMAALDNAPLTSGDGQLRLFETGAEAAAAAKMEIT